MSPGDIAATLSPFLGTAGITGVIVALMGMRSGARQGRGAETPPPVLIADKAYLSEAMRPTNALLEAILGEITILADEARDRKREVQDRQKFEKLLADHNKQYPPPQGAT